MSNRREIPAVYKVWLSDVLFEQLGAEGVEWGQPDAYGFYTPIVHTAPWDTVRKAIDAERRRIAEAWEDAKRTKGSTMHDVGGVIEVVDAIVETPA